jgi:hypothetical protein
VPYEEVLWYCLTWSGAVLSPYRPYRDTLQAAFRAVFARLGIRSVPRRHLATAVLLALFGGMLGLHHFYMATSEEACGTSPSAGWESPSSRLAHPSGFASAVRDCRAVAPRPGRRAAEGRVQRVEPATQNHSIAQSGNVSITQSRNPPITVKRTNRRPSRPSRRRGGGASPPCLQA